MIETRGDVIACVYNVIKSKVIFADIYHLT